MSGTIPDVHTRMDADAAREVLRSAVDPYVHASPDLLARTQDDIALAAQLKRDGLLTSAGADLLEAGLTPAELRTLVRETPSRLVGIAV